MPHADNCAQDNCRCWLLTINSLKRVETIAETHDRQGVKREADAKHQIKMSVRVCLRIRVPSRSRLIFPYVGPITFQTLKLATAVYIALNC